MTCSRSGLQWSALNSCSSSGSDSICVYINTQPNMMGQILLKVLPFAFGVRLSTAMGSKGQKVRRGKMEGLHTKSCSPIFVISLSPTQCPHESTQACQMPGCKVQSVHHQIWNKHSTLVIINNIYFGKIF